MEIEYIDKAGLEAYEGLLLPDVAAQLRAGQPIPAMGLSEDGTACGAIALWSEGGMLEIRSLYVAPASRRRGGGRMLVEAAAELAADSCPEMSINFEGDSEEADTLTPFLEALGFQQEDSQDGICFVTVAQLEECSFFAGHNGGKLAVPFARVPELELKQAYQACAAHHTNYMDRESFLHGSDPDLSMAVLAKKQVVSFAVLRQMEPGLMELSWVKSADVRHTAALLRAVFAACREKLTPETRISVQAVNESARELVDKLMPMAEKLTQSWVRQLG